MQNRKKKIKKKHRIVMIKGLLKQTGYLKPPFGKTNKLDCHHSWQTVLVTNKATFTCFISPNQFEIHNYSFNNTN